MLSSATPADLVREGRRDRSLWFTDRWPRSFARQTHGRYIAVLMDASPHAVPRSRASRSYWLCQLSGWGLYAMVEASVATKILRLPLGRSVLELTVFAALGVALTHMLRGVLRGRAWAGLPLRALAPRILGITLLLSLPAAAITHYMSIAALWAPQQVDLQSLHIPAGMIHEARGLILVLNVTALFIVWAVLYLTITALRDQRSAALRQSELTRALQLAELRLLKSQLNPHFLFNSLNSVRALIADDPAGAQKAVTQLARTLRYTLTAGREELVTLSRELEIVGRLLGTRVFALRGTPAHRTRPRSRGDGRACPSHAAADSGRECHQARDRGTAGRRRSAHCCRAAGRHTAHRCREHAPAYHGKDAPERGRRCRVG